MPNYGLAWKVCWILYFFNLFVLSLIYKDKFVYKKIPYYKVPQKYKYVYYG